MYNSLIIIMLWKKIKRYLPILGIGLFIYLLIKLNIGKIFKQILETNKFYLIIALFFVLFYLLFGTLKWHILAKKQKIPILFRESFKINLISNFYGLITPGRLGSAVRIGYLKKYSDLGKGISNFVIDKVLSFISLFFMAPSPNKFCHRYPSNNKNSSYNLPRRQRLSKDHKSHHHPKKWRKQPKR